MGQRSSSSRKEALRVKALPSFALFFALAAAALAQEPALTGRWEGEIELPRRPLVVLVDFDTKQGWLGLTGSRVFPLALLEPEAGEIRFELPLGKETIRFRGVKEAEGLRGTATIEDLQGPFLLRRLPELPPVHTRDDAWRQDLDVVLTRFLPYDRSFSDAARE